MWVCATVRGPEAAHGGHLPSPHGGSVMVAQWSLAYHSVSTFQVALTDVTLSVLTETSQAGGTGLLPLFPM